MVRSLAVYFCFTLHIGVICALKHVSWIRARTDGGKTWSLGAIGQQGTRESQVVQIPSLTADAQIYGTERNMGAKPGDSVKRRKL